MNTYPEESEQDSAHWVGLPCPHLYLQSQPVDTMGGVENDPIFFGESGKKEARLRT